MKEARSALKGIHGPLRPSRDVAAILSLGGSAVVWSIVYAPWPSYARYFKLKGYHDYCVH